MDSNETNARRAKVILTSRIGYSIKPYYLTQRYGKVIIHTLCHLDGCPENRQPLFSVEFDGPVHRTSSEQQRRDRLKNELCEHFAHSLLRINGRYLSPDYRGLDLLTYFIGAWLLEDAFYSVQQAGSVPWDEPFDISIIYWSGDGKKMVILALP